MPLREKSPDCPVELEQIVARCLEKEPQQRYAVCSDLLHDIEELAHRRPRETAGNLATAPIAATSTSGTERLAGPGPGGRSPNATPNLAQSTMLPPRSLSLGEVELDPLTSVAGRSQDARTTVSFERPGGPGKWIAAGLLAIVIAAGGWGGWRWWQETRQIPPPGGRGAASTASVPSPSVGSEGALTSERRKESPREPVADSTAPAQQPTGSTATTTAGPPPSANSTASDAAAPAEQAEPAPPAAPKPAMLSIAPAWDSAMSLRIGSKVWTLDRERRLDLAAGTYTLKFAIETPSYSHSQETSVRLKEGETRRIVSPIDRPGKLTVQPHINARQAFVRLDGGPALPTPLRGRWISPGPHVVAIVATQDPLSPVLRQEKVQIRSEIESILTFDLDDRNPQRLAEKPILPN